MNTIKKFAPLIVYATSIMIVCLSAFGLFSFCPPRHFADVMGHMAILCTLSVMLGICSCEFQYWMGDRKKVLIVTRYPI